MVGVLDSGAVVGGIGAAVFGAPGVAAAGATATTADPLRARDLIGGGFWGVA